MPALHATLSKHLCRGLAAAALLGLVACAEQAPVGLLGTSAVFDASVASPEDIAAALQRDGRVTLRGVLFETDSDVLSNAGLDAASRLSTAMVNNPSLRVAVVGHTDSTGAFRYNLGLSERRAVSMARELSRGGVEQDRIVPVGVGEIAPVDTNDTDLGRSQNRRVEVVIIE